MKEKYVVFSKVSKLKSFESCWSTELAFGGHLDGL